MFEFGFLKLMIIGVLVGGLAVVVLFRRKTQNIPKPQQSSANIESVSNDPKNKCPLSLLQKHPSTLEIIAAFAFFALI